MRRSTKTAAGRAARCRRFASAIAIFLLAPGSVLAGAPAPQAPPLPAVPAGASVHFVAPTDGAHVSGPLVGGMLEVDVRMGVSGIDVKPAGPVLSGSGHHHLLIDTGPLAAGVVVPSDATHLHFGKGQTESVIRLAPGQYRLTLQLADGVHRSYGPALSASIVIHVEAAPR